MVVDAIRYVVDHGCKGRALPHGLPAIRHRLILPRPLGRAQAVDDLHDRLRGPPTTCAGADTRRRERKSFADGFGSHRAIQFHDQL